MPDARHKVELCFQGGVMTAKLICPPEGGCSEHEGQCDARDWFDNVATEEIMQGKVSVPVAIEWPKVDEGPEIKIIEPEPGQRVRDERAIIGVFVSDLPETVRILNAPAIVDEIELGREVTVPDEERPDEEVYERYQLALDELVAADILQTGEHLGITVYGMTVDRQRHVGEQVFHYLNHLVGRVGIEAERGDIGPIVASNRAALLEKAACMVRPENCP